MRTEPVNVLILAVGVALIGTDACPAQSSFQNLDFESATVVPVPGDFYGRTYFATAFPGWTGYVATRQLSRNLYNHLFVNLDSACIVLLDSGYSGGTMEGNFTAVLEVGNDPGSEYTYPGNSNTPADVSLSQTGLVPGGARSIQFLSSGERNGFHVTLGGQEINVSVIGTRNGHDLFGGDISQFAGLTEELRFTASSAPSSPDDLFLDSIEFSSQPVPEPSAAGFLGVAGALFGLRRWRSRSRQSACAVE